MIIKMKKAFFILALIFLSCNDPHPQDTTTMSKPDDKTSYELTKIFSASPEKVFNAFVDESILKKIWGVSEIKIDARAGGTARALLQIGADNWNFTLTYKEVIPNEKLRWIVHFDRFPAKETRATLLFRKVETGTELTLRQENFESPQERDDNKKANEQGLRTLDSLICN